MIAIDTNILVRHLTEDDREQLKLVHVLFKKNNKDGAIFVSLIVLLELNWVLEGCYQWSNDKFCNAIDDILRCSQFTIENSLAVKMAVSRCRKNEEFSDALIGQVGMTRNLKTYTFDKGLKNDTAFIILSKKG